MEKNERKESGKHKRFHPYTHQETNTKQSKGGKGNSFKTEEGTNCDKNLLAERHMLWLGKGNGKGGDKSIIDNVLQAITQRQAFHQRHSHLPESFLQQRYPLLQQSQAQQTQSSSQQVPMQALYSRLS